MDSFSHSAHALCREELARCNVRGSQTVVALCLSMQRSATKLGYAIFAHLDGWGVSGLSFFLSFEMRLAKLTMRGLGIFCDCDYGTCLRLEPIR